MGRKDASGAEGPDLVSMFGGAPGEVLAGMRDHFVWLAEDAARAHNPVTDWDGFVDRLWRTTARWAGWAEDGRNREDVDLAWFEGRGDPKVTTWFEASEDRPTTPGVEPRGAESGE